MLRHYLIAALRNMAANRLISAISILGLAVGIAAAIVMALVIRNQLTFDHFIPGYDRTYLSISMLSLPERPPMFNDVTHRDTAALLKLNAPEVESATRLMLADREERGGVELSRGDVSAQETVYWAEPNLFAVLPLPLYRGDLRAALARADGIVLPRAMARKYFGRDDATGQVLKVNGHPMTVRAVIEDLSNSTDLKSGIFVSSLAPFSAFASDPVDKPGGFHITVRTYVRLCPGADIAAVERRLPKLVDGLTAGANAIPGKGRFPYAMSLVRIDRINLLEGLYPGARMRLAVQGFIGSLILFIALVNFVNLLTARAARRAREVGMRKACGADRRHLMAQFLGEAVLTAAFAACFAVALAEWVLPKVNAFLQAAANFAYWREPLLLVTLLLGVGALGLAAGAYPAFLLSAFHPTRVLKDSALPSGGSGTIRKCLTGLQFSILVVLMVATIVVWQQRVYAMREGLRVNIDQMLMVRGACLPAFRTELRKLPGVAGVACTNESFLDNGMMTGVLLKGQPVMVDVVQADRGVFALYGITPVAGSLATTSPDGDSGAPHAVILNQAAVRRLGFASPQAAIGKLVPLRWGPDNAPVPVMAVVPDFALYSVERAFEPVAFLPDAPPSEKALVSIKLKGGQVPETLAAIDRLWSATGKKRPVDRFFLDAHMQELYAGMVRQAQLLAGFSGLAVLLACLGLVGIAIATAERRTKEIGVRKAMGAGTGQVVALLLWQFAQPVLWANVIAWPVAWWLMRRWLSGFAYHIDLHWWVFAAASAGALTIALATVAGQAWITARRKAVLALRYE